MPIRYYKTALIIGIPMLAFSLSFVALLTTVSDVSLSDWLEDDGGYQRAMAVHAQSSQPVILFFHTEWCSSCKALTKNVLINEAVKRELADFIRVKINPETSAQTQDIARKYGVLGFPTLVIIPARGGSAHQYIPKQGVDP